MQNFRIGYNPPEPQTTLGSLLSGRVRFLTGHTSNGTFLIGAEDDEPQLLTVRFA